MYRFYLLFCFLIVSCSRDFSLLTVINFELNGTIERMLLNFRHVQFESLLRGRLNAIFCMLYVICFRLQEVGSEDRICENLNLINPQDLFISINLLLWNWYLVHLVPTWLCSWMGDEINIQYNTIQLTFPLEDL